MKRIFFSKVFLLKKDFSIIVRPSKRVSEKIQINIFFTNTKSCTYEQQWKEEEKLGTWCVWKASICERFIFGGWKFAHNFLSNGYLNHGMKHNFRTHTMVKSYDYTCNDTHIQSLEKRKSTEKWALAGRRRDEKQKALSSSSSSSSSLSLYFALFWFAS